MVELADHHEVLEAGEVLVDGGVLTARADHAAHLVGVAQHVDAVDDGGAGVGLDERREHLDGGGLAGAVGAEQRGDGALRDVEVKTVERAHDGRALRGVGLDEVAGLDECHERESTPQV